MLIDTLGALKAALVAFEEAAAAENGPAQVATAAEFYALILANCGNPILEEVTRDCWHGSASSVRGPCH